MSRFTKNAIRGALLDLLAKNSMDDITVRMVCEKAGVSRQTLYNHYYCLMDVVDDLFRQELAEDLTGNDSYREWVGGFRQILTYFRRRKTVYGHVYHSSYRREMMRMIERTGHRLIVEGIEQCAADSGADVSEGDKAFMADYYCDVFMGIIGRYFKGGLEEDPTFIAERCAVMMDHPIERVLCRLTRSGGKG
ncbi:MAG: TetR/AcrR family transcriptional regulator C-terminal domain-containing protein [Bacillota bacterium]|jgi:AcrR family transcriptional regulator